MVSGRGITQGGDASVKAGNRGVKNDHKNIMFTELIIDYLSGKILLIRGNLIKYPNAIRIVS